MTRIQRLPPVELDLALHDLVDRAMPAFDVLLDVLVDPLLVGRLACRGLLRVHFDPKGRVIEAGVSARRSGRAGAAAATARWMQRVHRSACATARGRLRRRRKAVESFSVCLVRTYTAGAARA